jgi:integrase
MHADGGGLYLQVVGTGKSWLFRFAMSGHERQMGLGSLATVSLADARAAAADCRKLVKDGVDPIERRRAERAAAQLSNAKAMTFDQCRDAYANSHRTGWRSARHAAQWKQSLETYTTPVFGRLPVQAIDVGLVMKALEPIWTAKPETAGRVRGRIEAVLDWAKAHHYRTGENPARWRGHLKMLLPALSKVHKVRHHPAMTYSEIGAFLVSLRSRQAIAARALEFAILTAARPGEVMGMRWGEVDLSAKVWTIPGERMKAGREHRVPLSEPGMRVLHRMQQVRESDYVFPGERRARLSHMAMLKLLERMGRGDLTAHGFRSTFRDWAGDRPDFQREVAEAALAHVVGDETERAYRRGDALEKRRKLMDAWAEYCAAPAVTGKVLAFRAAE